MPARIKRIASRRRPAAQKVSEKRDSTETSGQRRMKHLGDLSADTPHPSSTYMQHPTPAVSAYMEMRMVDDRPPIAKKKSRSPTVRMNNAYLQKLQAQNIARRK